MSSYSSLLSASGGSFVVEKGCSESGEMCIPFEVHERVSPLERVGSRAPGRVGSPGRVGPPWRVGPSGRVGGVK